MGMLARFLEGAPPPTRFWLTRAGPVENPGGVLYSHPGLPLSNAGTIAIRDLARRLDGKAVAHVYAADSQAESEAARILAELLDARHTLAPELRERSWGSWEGMSFTEVRDRYPAAVESWKSDEAGFSPPGGESLLDVRSRSLPFLEQIRKRHTAATVVIVGNCAVNRVALAMALPFLTPAEGLRLEQDYASWTELRFYGADGVLVRLNT